MCFPPREELLHLALGEGLIKLQHTNLGAVREDTAWRELRGKQEQRKMVRKMCPTTKAGFCFVEEKSGGRGEGNGDTQKVTKRLLFLCRALRQLYLSDIKLNVDNWVSTDVEVRKPYSSLPRDAEGF